MDGSLVLGLIRVVVVLLLVIPAVIFATRWYARKQMPSGELKIKATLPLGQNKALYVIDWRGKELLIGVTNQAISLLNQLETKEPEEMEVPES